MSWVRHRVEVQPLWWVYAALTSVFVLVHMVRRRRLPDADRLDGLPRLTRVGG